MVSWLDRDFDIPLQMQAADYRLRMLTVNDLVKDYDAVMSSQLELQGVFGPQSQWPIADMTMEQDLIDLGWHQKEFQNRSSFAYTMMSLDEVTCLGCVYIYPTYKADVDAQVIMWVRSGSELDQQLYADVQQWLTNTWPFHSVVYPGRNVTWSDWLDQD
jgi:hypothetical protein